jgi:hypothetical protein
MPKKTPSGFHPLTGETISSDKVFPNPETGGDQELEFGKKRIFWSFTQYLGEPEKINYQRFAWDGSFKYKNGRLASGVIDSVTRAFYMPEGYEYEIEQEGRPRDGWNESTYKYVVAGTGAFSTFDSFLAVTEETMDQHEKMSLGYEFASWKNYASPSTTYEGTRGYTAFHSKDLFRDNGLGYLEGNWWNRFFSSDLV